MYTKISILYYGHEANMFSRPIFFKGKMSLKEVNNVKLNMYFL